MNYTKYLGLKVPLDDEKVWSFIASGKSLKGIFQLETESASRVLQKIKPLNINDLSIVNSLNRPGSLKFADEIADIRDGKKKAEYLHPALEPFLKETYGSLVYQEEVLLIAQKLANFKAVESNALLKALGKKKKDVLMAQKEAFMRGMKENGFEPEVSEKLFGWFEAFADYSFNKSHSVSYSTMGYISAYIKYHHPLEFITSLLNFTQFEQKPVEEIAECVSELEDFGIKILPPSIKKLDNKFRIEGPNIRHPIGLIKALGDTLFEKLKTLTEIQTSSLDRCLEAFINIGLNSRSVESIIICGGLDELSQDRESVLFYYWFISELQPEILEKFWAFKNGHAFSPELIFEFINYRVEIMPKGGKQGDLFDQNQINKNIKYKSHFKTEATRKKVLGLVEGYKKQLDKFKEAPHLTRFFWETYVLGYSFNYNFSSNKTFRQIENMDSGQGYTVGFIEEVTFRTSQKGNDYGIMRLRFDKKMDFMLFSEVCEGAKGLLKEKDLVKIRVSKYENKLKVESINVINSLRGDFEFYNKAFNPAPEPK